MRLTARQCIQSKPGSVQRNSEDVNLHQRVLGWVNMLMISKLG